MKILIAGNQGYVGPVVVRHLRRVYPTAKLLGFDCAYFAHCLTGADRLPESHLDEQHFGDIREFPNDLLKGVDVVVNLAAISNDPMGNQFSEVTAEINHVAGVRLAKAAKAAGVRSFVFASSCSVYGFAEDGPRSESSVVDPLTPYARSKVATENDLQSIANSDFSASCLRFATACGWSPRLRLDLVLNDFVASALATGNITILSDGTPWRPLIHVDDMARAIEWAVSRTITPSTQALVVNVGSDEWNVQVLDLARAVAGAIPGCTYSVDAAAPPDKRSYRVDFALFRNLAPEHQPQVSLQQAIDGLRVGLQSIRFSDANFRAGPMVRLSSLRQHLSDRRLDEGLHWR